MNGINQFSLIPAQTQRSIIFKTYESPPLDIALVCKVWHALLCNFSSHLSPELLVHIFSLESEYNPLELSKIALVCKRWYAAQGVNSLWKPALNRCIKTYRYNIDLVPDSNYKEQLMELNESRFNDFKDLLLKSAEILRKSQAPLAEPTTAEVKYFLNKFDHTDLFKKLITKKSYTTIFNLILYRIEFNSQKIVRAMLFAHIFKCTCLEFNLLLSLLIKLNYNLHDLFSQIFDQVPAVVRFAISTAIKGQCEGIKVADLIASGMKLNQVEATDPKISVLQEFFPHFEHFYEMGTFLSCRPGDNFVCFDEKLKKHLRTAPCNEDEMQDFIFDLLTIAGLDLNRICPAKGNLEKGSALSQLRQLAATFPKGNAIAGALEKFDKLT